MVASTSRGTKFTQTNQSSDLDLVVGGIVEGLEDVGALLHDNGHVLLLAGGGDDGLAGHQLLDVVLGPGHRQHHLQQTFSDLGVAKFGSVEEKSCHCSEYANLKKIIQFQKLKKQAYMAYKSRLNIKLKFIE